MVNVEDIINRFAYDLNFVSGQTSDRMREVGEEDSEWDALAILADTIGRSIEEVRRLKQEISEGNI